MADYATLKAAIAAAIKENGNGEITGNLLQQSLLAMVNSLGVGYQYVGIATPAINPGTPDQNVFYLASTAGTYANFDGLVLADGEIAILKYNGAWSKDSTGAASLEKVNQLGQNIVHENIEPDREEIEITDDEGNLVGTIDKDGADFKNLKINGTQVVASDNIKDESEQSTEDEIMVSDDSGNEVARFDKDGFSAKQFKTLDGKEIVPLPKYDYFRKVNLFSTKSLSDFTNTTWEQTGGGAITCTGTGTGNKLTLPKDFFVDYREFRTLLNLGSDNKFIFLFTGASSSYWHTVGKSQIDIDFVAKTISIHFVTGTNVTTISESVTSKSFENIITNNKIWVTLKRIGCSLSVKLQDYYTSSEIELSLENLGWQYGNMNGFLDMYLHSGTSMPSIETFEVNSCLEPDIVFAGDSITECSAIRDNVYKGMPYLFRGDNLKVKSMVWARGGCTINSLFAQWQLEMSKVKPKTIVLNIGANGGNSIANFETFKGYCDDIGARLVVCYVVCFTMENRHYYDLNADIKTYCDTNSIPFIRLDIATALNNNAEISSSQLPNSALFLSDGVHPNEQGNMEMYKRVKVDAMNLFNI